MRLEGVLFKTLCSVCPRLHRETVLSGGFNENPVQKPRFGLIRVPRCPDQLGGFYLKPCAPYALSFIANQSFREVLVKTLRTSCPDSD